MPWAVRLELSEPQMRRDAVVDGSHTWECERDHASPKTHLDGGHDARERNLAAVCANLQARYCGGRLAPRHDRLQGGLNGRSVCGDAVITNPGECDEARKQS